MGSYQTADNARYILAAARDTIRAELENGQSPDRFVKELAPIPHNGLFVTLYNAAALRGCIGTFSGERSFVETLKDMAAASLTDPRFVDMPVSIAELPRLQIEVSVLSPLVKLDDPLDFEFGVDGILLERDDRRGCFLPEVGQELGWDQETFLAMLCTSKAGLAPDAWRETETELYKFSVWKICE